MRQYFIFFVLILSLLFLSYLSLNLGNYHVSASRTFHLLKSWILGQPILAEGYDDTIILFLRLPRIIMVLLVGATLGTSGCVSQGLFRNPLVSPFILGISAGASFGAAFAIVFLPKIPFSLDVMAALGGFLAVVLAYFIARRADGFVPRLALVLGGIIVGSFFSALVGILQYIADAETQLPAITFWMMGGFGTIAWESLFPAIYIIPVCLLLLMIFSWHLNVLSLGDREAMALGMNTEKWKLFFILLVVIAVGCSVSRSGVIGWIGLIVPHISRGLIGPNHRDVLPVSALIGSILLLMADDIARTITTGEIPVGIITAIIGAPFFVVILRKRERELWN